MVHMGVAEQYRGRCRCVERSGQQPGRVAIGIERTTGIEDQAIAIRKCEFDARATNGLGAAMDGDRDGQFKVSLMMPGVSMGRTGAVGAWATHVTLAP